MKFTTPQSVQHEHEALHERLRQATQAGGEVGEAARTLARLMHPHFVKEDQIALPPLGLLAALARGEWNAEMGQVLPLTEQLEAELPQMLAEHQSIVAALNKLREVAARAGRSDIVAFAECPGRTCTQRGRGDVPSRGARGPGGAATAGPAGNCSSWGTASMRRPPSSMRCRRSWSRIRWPRRSVRPRAG